MSNETAKKIGEALGLLVPYLTVPLFIKWAGCPVPYWQSVAGLFAIHSLVYVAARGAALGVKSAELK